MKTIKVNPLDKRSVNNAIKQIEAYKRNLMGEKCNKFVRRLAEKGYEIAKADFKAAKYDGDNDVTVNISGDGSSLKIVANGKAVCFIEFGAGVARGGGYPDDRKPDGIVGLGQFGKGHGATGKPWYYAHGKMTDGNPPAMAMLRARDTMVEEITQIAREVFGK